MACKRVSDDVDEKVVTWNEKTYTMVIVFLYDVVEATEMQSVSFADEAQAMIRSGVAEVKDCDSEMVIFCA